MRLDAGRYVAPHWFGYSRKPNRIPVRASNDRMMPQFGGASEILSPFPMHDFCAENSYDLWESRSAGGLLSGRHQRQRSTPTLFDLAPTAHPSAAGRCVRGTQASRPNCPRSVSPTRASDLALQSAYRTSAGLGYCSIINLWRLSAKTRKGERYKAPTAF
jgi:hypothetical protein